MPVQKTVYKYDFKGNFLTSYDSINLAAKKNNIPVTCVREAAMCNKIFGCHAWSYEKHSKIIPVQPKSKYEESRKLFKSVLAKKDDREIEFESISECANFIGCHRSAISQIINPSSNMKTIYGWSVQQLPSLNQQ